MIPTFPTFKRVELADRQDVEAHTSRFEPYSDFNFTSLWAWDVSNDRMISQLNGNLIVRFTDYRTNEAFLSFLGDRQPEETARQLILHSRAMGFPTELRLVPAISIAGTSNLSAQEDRDNFDYLYSTRQHAELNGPDFKRSRNFVRKFERDYPGAVFRTIDLCEPRVRSMVIELLKRWEGRRSGHSTDIGHEREAIGRLLETFPAHRLLATGICEGDTLLGFSIDELLPNAHCICHFWKAEIRCGGVYDYLLHRKAIHLLASGIERINCEQDLGVAGLRKSKTSYRPVSFLKKYRVTTQCAGGH
jgi:hypothetical protein